MEPADITSPLSATVAHVAAPPGTEVAEGQPVLFLELMKMEHPVLLAHADVHLGHQPLPLRHLDPAGADDGG